MPVLHIAHQDDGRNIGTESVLQTPRLWSSLKADTLPFRCRDRSSAGIYGHCTDVAMHDITPDLMM